LNGNLIKLGGPLYVSFAVAILSIFASVYIIENKERDNDHRINEELLNVHRLVYACQFCANQTLGLVSDSFLVYFLLASWDTHYLAWVMIGSYALHLIACAFVLFTTLGIELKAFEFHRQEGGGGGLEKPTLKSSLQQFIIRQSSYISVEHMCKHKLLYALLIVTSIFQAPFLSLLPWKSSTFATYSGGYPNMLIFRLCEYPALVQNIAVAVVITFYVKNYVNSFGSEIPLGSLAFLYFTIVRHFFTAIVNLSKTLIRARMLLRLMTEEEEHILEIEEKFVSKFTLEDLEVMMEAQAHYKITSNYAALEERLLALMRIAYRRHFDDLIVCVSSQGHDEGDAVSEEEDDDVVGDGVYRGSLESEHGHRLLAETLHDDELDTFFRATLCEVLMPSFVQDKLNLTISNENGKSVLHLHGYGEEDDVDTHNYNEEIHGDIKMSSLKKMSNTNTNTNTNTKQRKQEKVKQISVEDMINKHRVAALIRMRIESLITKKNEK
jgi:hypothetical protein